MYSVIEISPKGDRRTVANLKDWGKALEMATELWEDTSLHGCRYQVETTL